MIKTPPFLRRNCQCLLAQSQAYVAAVILWSHGSLPLSVQLAVCLRLLAQLLLRERDVGIHQAPSNATKQKTTIREGGQ